MSADAWQICPRCAENYPGSTEREFREDWEIGLEPGAVVTVSYRGECQHCGLLLEFREDHPVTWTPPVNEPNTSLALPLTWVQVPAGWWVKTPAGQWLEVQSTGLVGDRQLVTLVGSGSWHRDPAGAVTACPGTLHQAHTDALKALGMPEVLEDEPPW